MKNKAIWITWERQRRSLELANAFGAKYYELSTQEGIILYNIIRYVILSIKTIYILFKEKPYIVFAQNPSMVLCALLCPCKVLFSYKLVVDRHSNFKFETVESYNPKWKLFHLLSKFTIRNADITIVTNKYLFDIVNSYGGEAEILQDKLPNIYVSKREKLKGEFNIVFVSTYSDDEPVDEVIGAASLIDNNYIIYITGDYKKFNNQELLNDNLPANILLTGFLPIKEYEELISSADLLIVLTKDDHTLNCGIYEGIVLGKPIIASDTKAIRDYFNEGIVYTKIDVKSIYRSILKSIDNYIALEGDIKKLSEKISCDWKKRFYSIRGKIESL